MVEKDGCYDGSTDKYCVFYILHLSYFSIFFYEIFAGFKYNKYLCIQIYYYLIPTCLKLIIIKTIS